MVKSLLLVFVVCLSFNSFSMRKKKQLELIESCKIISDQRAIFAGTTLPVIMSFALETGEVVYSNKGARFGFKDFYITIQGSGQRLWKGKRKLTLASYYDAIDDPYIRVKAQMIEKPEVSYELSIPIHFKGRYAVSYNGASGKIGEIGHNGRRGINGTGTYRNGDGKDGRAAEQGYNGYRGTDGYNGDNVQVYVSKVDFPRDNTKLMKIETRRNGGQTSIRYLDPTGQITIYAEGGAGGSGGKGGRGGNGGNGSDGLYQIPASDNHPGCRTEGYGGNGGDAGFGGHGGDGGNGGNGGDVSIYFTDDAWSFKSHIIVENWGGAAGVGGQGGDAGHKGKFGRGGKGSGQEGRNGRCGAPGYRGQAGQRGQIYYYGWN